MKRKKANMQYEKKMVMNLCHCICGGDWFCAAKFIQNNNGILSEMKIWICDNCGKIYERKIELQRIVVEENLKEVDLLDLE